MGFDLFQRSAPSFILVFWIIVASSENAVYLRLKGASLRAGARDSLIRATISIRNSRATADVGVFMTVILKSAERVLTWYPGPWWGSGRGSYAAPARIAITSSEAAACQNHEASGKPEATGAIISI